MGLSHGSRNLNKDIAVAQDRSGHRKGRNTLPSPTAFQTHDGASFWPVFLEEEKEMACSGQHPCYRAGKNESMHLRTNPDGFRPVTYSTSPSVLGRGNLHWPVMQFYSLDWEKDSLILFSIILDFRPLTST